MSRDDNLCWFHGRLPRDEAEKILRRADATDGVFLVRESSTSPGDYVLSVLHNNVVWHYQIRRHGEDAFFSIDDQQPIHGLDSLIEHYQKASNGLVTQLSAVVHSYVHRDPPPPDSRSHGLNNLLHRATKYGGVDIVAQLLQSNYRNLDAKNELGQTAVHLACLETKIEILKLLINSGANVNCRDKDGNTPLHYACRSKPATVIQLLVEAKANIQSRNNDTGCVPLHDAARNGNLEAVKQLLEMGAPHLPRSAYGETPVQFARDAGHTIVVDYLDNYTPAAPKVHEYHWYHGTLDRNEAGQILRQHAKTSKTNLKFETGTDQNACADEDDNEMDGSGTFLVRYSKKENTYVLTLLDKDQLKNFIIKKHLNYLYIDEGPYMLSLEHLVQHYMRFSDGLPINLRYPVQPKPKPPLPLPSTIPRQYRKKLLSGKSASSSPSNDQSPTSINQSKERKLSMETVSPSTLQRTQRNFSIPSDDLMNQCGLSTSPPSLNIIGASDALTSPSITTPKKSPAKSILSSLKRIKSKDKPKTEETNEAQGNEITLSLQSNDEIAQSLRNLTFSADFKNPDLLLYNVPKNSNARGPADVQNLNANFPAPVDEINANDVDQAKYFVQSDKQNTTKPATALYNFDGDGVHDKDNSVEEIYFVDAPTKTIPISSSSFNYVAFNRIPYFPNANHATTIDSAYNNNANNNVNEVIPSNRTSNHLERADSTVSSASNDSELMLLFQSQNNQNANADPSTVGPYYYIPKNSICLNEVLGEGEFGSVYRGSMKCEVQNQSDSHKEIPVAIKTLHDEHCKENRAEFLREASVMIKLSHHCIVKLIGISKGPPLMIVQELVLLGSLVNFLQKNAETINPNVELKIWASQIACGMNYLETQHFVHRDLAARNILLSSIHQAKISDFGLSRALCANNNYYQASQGGKWPIKWYAPESFNYGTFSHASDVWSFGITLWEMFSFGEAPYGSMKGVDVIKIVEEGKRLNKPDACPKSVFKIMSSCWNYNPKDRPSFRHLTEYFSNDREYTNLIEAIRMQNIYENVPES